MPDSLISGRHVLIVEDEYYFADELDRAFKDAGAKILGPVPSTDTAFELLDGDTVPDAAVLDLNLGGTISYRVADALLARGIPFAFVTGYDQEIVPERHGAVRWLKKPVDASVIVEEVGQLIASATAPGRPRLEPDRRLSGSAVTHTRNTLLDLLSTADRARVFPHLERVALRQADILYEPGQPIEHVYFLEGGLSSELAVNSDGNTIEVGCVGREGFTGVPALLDVERSAHRTIMEVGGLALRIATPDLTEAMDGSRSLRALLLRFVHVFMVQIAATALADGRYKVEQRLARWLLMAHDRLDGDELPLTHEFLAVMLGVRRPGVTNAIHILEGERLIRARRGRQIVLDRKRLEEAAGGSYGVPEAEYRRLIGDEMSRR